jgi:hypothetical protein
MYEYIFVLGLFCRKFVQRVCRARHAFTSTPKSKIDKIMVYKTAKGGWCSSSMIVVVLCYEGLYNTFCSCWSKFMGPQKSAALGAGHTLDEYIFVSFIRHSSCPEDMHEY